MNNHFTKSIFATLLFCCCFQFVFSQSFIGFKLVKNQNTNQLDVFTTQFQDVIGFQFGIEFDNANLNMTSVTSYDPLKEESVRANQIGTNVLLSWISETIEPITITQEHLLFSIAFDGNIEGLKFCSSDSEIMFEGVVDLNGSESVAPLFFIDDCSIDTPCTLVCNNEINISLPQSGSLTFTASGMEDMFLEGNSCAGHNLELSIYHTQEDLMNGQSIADPTFTQEDDGKELFYQIKDLEETAGACWGKLILTYKITGTLIAPEDKDADCASLIPVDGNSDTGIPLYYVSKDNAPKGEFGQEDDIQNIGKFNSIEGPMTDLSVYVVDDHSNLDACGMGNLKRAYYLVDINSSVLSINIQNINVGMAEGLSTNNIEWPGDIVVSCGAGLDETGEPRFESSICALLASAYSDEVLIHDDGEKIIRTWTIINWCTNETFTSIQIIKTDCIDNGSGSGSNAEEIRLAIRKNDDEHKLDFVVENFKNGLGFQFGIEVNDPDLKLTDLYINDLLNKNSIQENQIDNNMIFSWINQNLSPTNVASGEVLFTLAFDDSVKDLTFCSSDKEILFEAVVDKDGELTGVPMVIVDACDNSNGLITAPENSEANCNEEIPVTGLSDEGATTYFVNNDAAPFGSFGDEDEFTNIGFYANISTDLNGMSVYVLDKDSDLDGCGNGELIRTFYLQDDSGTTLGSDDQSIIISSIADFNESQIEWPANITVECGAGIDVTGEPIVEENSCQLIALSYEDEILEGGVKILRTWYVVDWCSAGVFSQVQIIQTDCDPNEDTLSPIAICLNGLVVNLENESQKIWAQDLDEGSYDNVGIVSYEIKKEDDTEYAEFITVDIEDEGTIIVNLRVTDAAGNFAECFAQMTVYVVDVNPCVLICNEEIVISLEQNQTFQLINSLHLDIFLEGNAAHCVDGNLVITLFDLDNNNVTDRLFTTTDGDFKGTYQVEDLNSGNTCWGTFSIEIKGEQLVWPGDANNDGIVNNFDVLNIGIGFDSEGPARENASSNWTGQVASDWNELFSNHLNYKFSDADGSGLIDYTDVDVVSSNWGEEHEFNGGSNSELMSVNDIPLFLQSGTYVSNKMVQIPIHLGSNALPADQIYGVAFSVSYDKEMIQSKDMNIDTDNSWLAVDKQDILSVQKNDATNGLIHFGMVRNDQTNMDGFGAIASLNLFFNTIDGDVFEPRFKIENIKLIDAQGNELPAVEISSPIIVQNQTTATYNISPVSVSIYPNPSNGMVNINSDTEITSVSVFNMDGGLAKEIMGDVSQVDLSHLSPSLYVLKIETAKETITKKVTLLKF